MNETIIRRAGELIAQSTGEESYCVLALIDDDGCPTAATITAAKSEGIRQLYFCTGLGSNWVRRIHSCNYASVCFNTGGVYNITLVGHINILTDAAIKQAMWYPGLLNHFTGPEDPNFCVLHFTTNHYSLLVDWQEARGTL